MLPSSTTCGPSPEPGGSNGRACLIPQTRQILVLHLILILFVAVVETSASWRSGLLWGHSTWMDAARIVEFDSAIRAGEYMPVWSPDFYCGYGSPLFQYYSPLAYFLAEVPMLAGTGIAAAFKITQLLALFASGLAMYRLAVTHLSRWAACFGAVLYMAAPYRIVDMFIRHALAEHCAFVWLPLIAWGTERFVSQRSRVGLATGILATSGLVFTHNIMALIGLPVCVVTGWALSERRKIIQTILLAGWPAAMGVGIMTFFWWPALTGRAFVCADTSLTQGYFDFHQHFVNAWKFLDTTWQFGESGPDAALRMPVQVGWPHLIAGAGALLLMFVKWRGSDKSATQLSRWTATGIIMLAGGLFMCHKVSLPLWEELPLLKYVQYPWRFLGLVVFGASMCGAALIDFATDVRLKAAFCGIGTIVVLAAYFPYYSQARFLVGDSRSNLPRVVSSEQLDVMESAGIVVHMQQLLTTDTIRTHSEGATCKDDYLPSQVRKKPASPPSMPISISDGETKQYQKTGLNRYRANVSMMRAGKMQLAQFWFPGWEARVDGKKTEIQPSGDYSVVSCEVPAGDHIVEFNYEGMPQRRVGMVISLFAAALAAVSSAGARFLFPCHK